MNNIMTHARITMDLVHKPWEEVQTYAQAHQEHLPLWLFATSIVIGLLIGSTFYGTPKSSN
jgi:hypothetical protein